MAEIISTFIPYKSYTGNNKNITHIYKDGKWVKVKSYIKTEITPAKAGQAIAGIARAT